MLRDRQEIVTRKMSAEELRAGVGRSGCEDDDMRTREMAALERDELLRIEAQARPASAPRQRRRPTMRTQRLRTSMIALVCPELPKTLTGRVAALASAVVIAIVVGLALR